jgi:P-type Cu+ transporter
MSGANRENKNNKPAKAIDPVCKMQVDPSRAAASFRRAGSMYYFCNPRCKDVFSANPEKFLGEDGAPVQAGADDRQAADEDLKAFYLPESAFVYTCPMDPEVQERKPASCPKCGMALFASVCLSQSDSEPDELADLKKRLLPCLIFTGLLLSLCLPGLLQIKLATDYLPWLELALATPVVILGGRPVFARAATAWKSRSMNMFTLIAFGVSISYLASLISLLACALTRQESHLLYFDSAAGIITLVLTGQILELKARTGSSKALESLFALAPGKARRQTETGWQEIPVFEVARGDRLQILPGDRIPADGLILSGRSSIDESLLTGNVLPVTRSEGERVLAGTINGDGSLIIQADSLGRHTVFARIIELLSGAQNSRSPIQQVADRASAFFIPAVLLIAATTFLAWLALGGSAAISHALRNAVSVLVIACPCALGLATPIAVSAAVARASRSGLLVKDARALEALGAARVMLIDKTGTLSQGSFEVVEIIAGADLSAPEALQRAASLEANSKHPLALSICREAKSRGLSLSEVRDIQYEAGLGIEGLIGTSRVAVGSARFMKLKGLDPDAIRAGAPPVRLTEAGTGQDAATSVYLSVDGLLKAVIVLADAFKKDAPAFVEQLRALFLRPEILSGDSKESVLAAGRHLQIPQQDLSWELLPQDKVERIAALRGEGQLVAMLGDGINDAAALAAADAGIAMSSGADIALTSAAINVMHVDLRSVTAGIRLSRLMTKTMKENLFLAFAYNSMALLLATGILYPSTGIELNPSIAAAAMSLSSLSVILNSMKISRAKL